MICVVTTPIDLGKYMEVYNILQRHPSEKVCHISWADFSKLASLETLYLIAHGSPASVEGIAADRLAELLVKGGLTSPIHKIKLTACGSGITGGAPGPYCQALADQIVKHGGPSTLVIGFDGITAVTDEFGKTYAKDTAQGSYPNWQDFLNQHGKDFANWDAIAKKTTFESEAKILDSIRAFQPQVQAIFEWLYENNRKYTKDSIKGKTYGIPGQKMS